MAQAGTAYVEVQGDFSKFNKQAKGAVGGLAKRFSKGLVFGGTGAAIAGVAGLTVALKKSVDAYIDAEKVSAQTNAVLKSTKGVAGVSAKAVDQLATQISRKSGLDDEAIKSGENLLLTFTNVRNEVGKGNKIFSRATSVVADMSVALGQDMKSSAIQVGKALNDPIKGVTALQRVGVSFTASQKDQIKTLVESGKTMQAQKLILRELNTEFGGSAKAAGDTTAGAMAKARTEVGNLQEGIGKGLAPTVKALSLTIAREVRQWTPAFERAARDVSNVLTRRDLSPTEKLERAFRALKINLGPLVDDIGRQLKSSDMGPELKKLLEDAAPAMINALAAAAPKAAGAFVKAFKGADTWGKLLTAGFLLSKLGAFNAVGGAAATAMDAAFRKVLIPKLAAAGAAGGLAAGGAEGASNAAVTAAFSRAGRLSGKAFRGAFIAAATFGLWEAVKKTVSDAKDIPKELGKSLRGPKAGKGSANDLLLFPVDAAILKLQASTDRLQAAFDRRDRVMQRAELKAAVNKARNAKGHEGLGDAKKALADFNRDLSRTGALSKINVKIQGIEQLKAWKGALADVRSEIAGKLSDALDAFKDKWESTVGAQFDKDTSAAIANGPAARALAALQAEDDRIRVAAEDAANAKGLAEAKTSGDKGQIAAAQAAIEETARQRAIATAQIAADAEADRIQGERQAARQRLYDDDSAAFSTKLSKDLEAEAKQLEDRKQSYSRFVKDINRLLAKIKIPGISTSAEVEAALTAGPRVKKRAGGGLLSRGDWALVGERGPELMRMGSDARVYSHFESQRMAGGATVNIGEIHNHTGEYDADRFASQLAWRIETAAA